MRWSRMTWSRPNSWRWKSSMRKNSGIWSMSAAVKLPWINLLKAWGSSRRRPRRKMSLPSIDGLGMLLIVWILVFLGTLNAANPKSNSLTFCMHEYIAQKYYQHIIMIWWLWYHIWYGVSMSLIYTSRVFDMFWPFFYGRKKPDFEVRQMNRHIRQVKEFEDDIAAITQQLTLATRVIRLFWKQSDSASVFLFYLIWFWVYKKHQKTLCMILLYFTVNFSGTFYIFAVVGFVVATLWPADQLDFVIVAFANQGHGQFDAQLCEVHSSRPWNACIACREKGIMVELTEVFFLVKSDTNGCNIMIYFILHECCYMQYNKIYMMYV